MEIVGFVRARLDEDEEDARAARTKHPWADGTESFGENSGGNIIGDGRSSVNDGSTLGARPIVVVHEDWQYPPQSYEIVEHIARHDPARVLREVEAKRRIVDELAPLLGSEAQEKYDNTDNVHYGIASERAERHIRLLASAWSDHPDYRVEWKP